MTDETAPKKTRARRSMSVDEREAARQQLIGKPISRLRTEASRDTPREADARGGERRRRRKGGITVDQFDIPMEDRSPGTSYEWKRETCVGKEDYSYMNSLHEQGWETVDVSAMPRFMPAGYKGPIRRDGMVLMERPEELTEEARREAAMDARDQVQVQKRRVTENQEGQLPRDHPQARQATKMTTSYEAIPVGSDE